jgi:hypothetical protein
MAEVTGTADGGASITITQQEAAGLRALAAQHLPFLERASRWFSADVAPELKQAADFLRSLASAPPEGTTLTVTEAEAQAIRGLLTAYLPDFKAVLAVVESPAVRALLTLAGDLL